MYDQDTVNNNFKYHRPTSVNVNQFGYLRESARRYANFILKIVPDSPERTLALRKLEECVMWANAGLARYSSEDNNTVD